MRTPSHFLITAVLRKALPRIPIVKSAVLLGSVAPDIPLLLLSVGGYFYFHNHLGWEVRETFWHIFNVLFFQDPLWITSHNMLQAPVVLVAGILTLWKVHGKERMLLNWWFWFLAACLLHAVIDILTHNDDGPLMLFPFDWDYRFASPVSYWDRDHYADTFSLIEYALDAVLTVYLVVPPVWRRIRRRLKR